MVDPENIAELQLTRLMAVMAMSEGYLIATADGRTISCPTPANLATKVQREVVRMGKLLSGRAPLPPTLAQLTSGAPPMTSLPPYNQAGMLPPYPIPRAEITDLVALHNLALVLNSARDGRHTLTEVLAAAYRAAPMIQDSSSIANRVRGMAEIQARAPVETGEDRGEEDRGEEEWEEIELSDGDDEIDREQEQFGGQGDFPES